MKGARAFSLALGLVLLAGVAGAAEQWQEVSRKEDGFSRVSVDDDSIFDKDGLRYYQMFAELLQPQEVTKIDMGGQVHDVSGDKLKGVIMRLVADCAAYKQHAYENYFVFVSRSPLLIERQQQVKLVNPNEPDHRKALQYACDAPGRSPRAGWESQVNVTVKNPPVTRSKKPGGSPFLAPGLE